MSPLHWYSPEMGMPFRAVICVWKVEFVECVMRDLKRDERASDVDVDVGVWLLVQWWYIKAVWSDSEWQCRKRRRKKKCAVLLMGFIDFEVRFIDLVLTSLWFWWICSKAC